MGKFTDNELRYDEWCHNLIFNYHIFESAGHPLFNDDAEIGGNFVDRLNNLIEFVEAKFDDAKIDFQGVMKNKITNNSYDVIVYKPITVALNKLGFKDVINAKNFPVKITVANIVEDRITRDDLYQFKFGGNGCYIWSKNDKINKRKQFIGAKTTGGKIEITCYAINGKLIASSFLEVFLHEYLHFYDSYNKVAKDLHRKEVDESLMMSNFKNMIKNMHLTPKDAEALRLLAYRLFGGEDNALIGNLFGYLITNKINTYADYIMHKDELLDHTYYNELKRSYEIAKDIPSIAYKMIMMNNPAFNKGRRFNDDGTYTEHYHDVSSKSSIALKKRFLKMCENKINKIYSKILRLVGRYIQLVTSCDKEIINTIVKY